MAYFHCLIGGGSSGGGYELTVTCDADFAGTTITCTDGVTTLTQTCPSASPYEVVFEIPNGGDWTISGVVSGHTVSTGVNIPTSASLIATIQQTVTIHSAKEDTISYIDIDGATQTITFASGETSKQVQITIEPSGNSFTFTSSVAKNPDNLSQDYSKTFTITTSTTDIYLMPDAVKTLYWWGYMSDSAEVISSANGWTHTNYTFTNPTFNTISARISSADSVESGIGSKNAINANKARAIAQGVTVVSSNYGFMGLISSKNTGSVGTPTPINANTKKLYEFIGDGSSKYLYTATANARVYDLFALWYE
jgi:hypothetical protein